MVGNGNLQIYSFKRHFSVFAKEMTHQMAIKSIYALEFSISDYVCIVSYEYENSKYEIVSRKMVERRIK